MEQTVFDIIIMGGGHAGVEATYAAAQFGLNVALISMPDVPLASAPCNPSIGGVGKGQVVREIDAMGGIMGFLADRAGIQFRTLNESKGYAVHSTRVQIDKEKYSEIATSFLSQISNLKIIYQKINQVKKSPDQDYFIIETENGWSYRTKKIIVTVGTFLGGKLHCGEEVVLGGRDGYEASANLQSIFSHIKNVPERFKTGTPARLVNSSIDYSQLEEQPSDDSVEHFHFANYENPRFLPQMSCYLARTNSETLKIIRANKERSPMYNGQIKAVGARYCPSIEDKAYRYPDKDIHHVFIEPEGLNLKTMYPSGISSSLPKEVQHAFIQSIDGLEKAEIDTYGYAVEYDVVDTTCLKLTLEHKEFEGLYFAGQVNGTSGYEEAAGQGLVAGLNAALAFLKKDPVIFSRKNSYIGVMIEDLVSNVRDEPYRLFTARSENRLYIREDNSIDRMWSYRTKFELNQPLDKYAPKYLFEKSILLQFCKSFSFKRTASHFELTSLKDFYNYENNITLADLLKDPTLDPIVVLNEILEHYQISFAKNIIKSVAIECKYLGYIVRFDQQNERVNKLDSVKIKWQKIIESENISFECKQRIEKIKPETFGQLKLIEGIRPATLAYVASFNV